MNPSGSNNTSNNQVNLCRSCGHFPALGQSYFCSHCINAQSMFNYAQNQATSNNSNQNAANLSSNFNMSNQSFNHSAVPNPPNFGANPPASNARSQTQIPAQSNPLPQGPNMPNSNFFPFFSSLEGVSEQDFNNAVFSEAGNLNFLGQNFASAIPPNFGNIHSSSSPNLSSLENENSQQPSDSNRFSSPPYEEEDDLNGIWVGDRTCPDNVFYYGCFPASLLGTTNKDTQEICEKVASLLQETHIEDDLPPPKDEIILSTAAKRHLLDLYFRYHYPFFPVLHKPTIMSQFELSKLPPLLLNVIFAIAIFYTDEKSYNFFPQLKEKTHEQVAEEFEAQAKKCLDECFSEAEIFTIQALLLMTLYHHRTTVSNNVWLYSGMATRMAMELGLHKDCENLLNGAFEPVEQEIRKKTWWGCFVLDILYSTMLGRPLSIQQELCDVKLPTLADDEDDPDEIPCTQVFIAMSKLGQIVGKLNRLLTSVKLKSNLQDRATRAHDCLVSLKNWFKSLPPSLKKLPETAPEDIKTLKNCFSEANLIPFLHTFYHTSIIVGQVLCHTDGLFRVTNTNLMGDAVNAATEIVRISTRFDSLYTLHGLSFKFYPLYVSAFLFLHKIRVSSSNTPQAQQSSESTNSSDQWYSLFLSCLTTLNKYAQHSENGRFSMLVLTGMAEHQKVKLPEALKRKNEVISTSNVGSGNNTNALFSSAMANSQALFGMDNGGIDAQTLNELAAMTQNATFNLDLNAAIGTLTGSNGQFNSSVLMASNLGANRSSDGNVQAFVQGQMPMGMFNPNDLMNLQAGISEQYLGSVMGNDQQFANIGQVEELTSVQANTQSNVTEVSSNSKSAVSQQNSSPQTQNNNIKVKASSQNKTQTSTNTVQPSGQQQDYRNFQSSQVQYQQGNVHPQSYINPQSQGYTMSHGGTQTGYIPQPGYNQIPNQESQTYGQPIANQNYMGQMYQSGNFNSQQTYGQVPNQTYNQNYDPNHNFANMNPGYQSQPQYQNPNFNQQTMQPNYQTGNYPDHNGQYRHGQNYQQQ